MGRHDDIRYSGGGALSSARPLVRRRLAWALAVPLIATSLEVAHAASYQLVYPDGPGRARVLALSGHGYERHFPAVAALLASVLVGALLARIFTPRRPGLMSIDARVFFALPPTAFVLQEALELVSAGQAPYDVALSPVLLPGLVMQLPFAALAWFVGHLLVDAADVVAHAIRCIPRVALHVFVTRLTSNRHELPPRRPPTSDAHPRGPPTRVSSRSGVPHPRRRPFDLTISGGFTMHRPLALVVVFAVLSLASVSAAFAHDRISNNGVTMTLHVDPNDEPVAEAPSTLVIESVEVQPAFSWSSCGCTLTVSDGAGKVVYAGTAAARVTVTFPSAGAYQATYAGRTPVTTKSTVMKTVMKLVKGKKKKVSVPTVVTTTATTAFSIPFAFRVDPA